MKAEEEEVDIDTIVTGAQAAVLGGLGTLSGNMGGAATPIGTAPGSYSMDVDKLGSGMGDDIEAAWAEEEPDTDVRGAWKMKVIMDGEEASEYY